MSYLTSDICEIVAVIKTFPPSILTDSLFFSPTGTLSSMTLVLSTAVPVARTRRQIAGVERTWDTATMTNLATPPEMVGDFVEEAIGYEAALTKGTSQAERCIGRALDLGRRLQQEEGGR